MVALLHDRTGFHAVRFAVQLPGAEAEPVATLTEEPRSFGNTLFKGAIEGLRDAYSRAARAETFVLAARTERH
jgi:hypothetical protein